MDDAPDPRQARLATAISLVNVVLIGPFTALAARFVTEDRPTVVLIGLFVLLAISCALAWWLAALRRRVLPADDRHGAAQDYLRTAGIAGLSRTAAIGLLVVALLPTFWGLSRLLPALIAFSA